MFSAPAQQRELVAPPFSPFRPHRLFTTTVLIDDQQSFGQRKSEGSRGPKARLQKVSLPYNSTFCNNCIIRKVQRSKRLFWRGEKRDGRYTPLHRRDIFLTFCVSAGVFVGEKHYRFDRGKSSVRIFFAFFILSICDLSILP